jgi:hypothetical protein
MAAGVASMSRPRKQLKPASTSQPEGTERETVINMKGSAEYAAWLEDVHRKTHIPKVQIFCLAIAEWAERHGHPSPPEI